MTELNSVQKFYVGKTIFITGASGFMGKVLLEKLLYSCSDVKEIIILMREKRGQSGRERVEKFKSLAMFQRIMNEKPEVMRKIFPVYGELSKPNFDLNQEHLKRVVVETSIFFHLAASVKFTAPLKSNVMMNLVGTKNALELAKQMNNLVQMIHLSTAFCNVEPEIAYEKVYDFPHDPDDLIRMAEEMSDKTLEGMQKELLGDHPNTYTYTKRLAEILVQREYGNLPVSIMRPSLVLPSYQEPVPGWVDNLNGLAGVTLAAAKGVLRSMLIDREGKIECLPVDTCINAILIAVKVLSTTKRAEEIPVYHLTVDDSKKFTIGWVFDIVKSCRHKYPLSLSLWYPDGNMTMNRHLHAVKVFLFQMIPAYAIDFLLFCFRQKTFMVQVQKRIADGLEVIHFFTMRRWHFRPDNFCSLIKELDESEYEMFQIDTMNAKGVREYIEQCLLGGRLYCANEPNSTLPRAKVIVSIQYVLHNFCKLLFYWFVIKNLMKAFGLYEPLKEFFDENFHSSALHNSSA